MPDAEKIMLNIADQLDQAIWLDIQEIEAVLARARGGAEVRMKSGTAYSTGRSARHVLDLIVIAKNGDPR